jgi:DNA processing protein
VRGREILFYLSQKYNGDFEKIFDAIEAKEKVDNDLYKEYKDKFIGNYITI